jgi:large subunit ribosomal protein L25
MASVKQLAATRRGQVGKGAARAVRRDNRVPAVVYGGGVAPLSISLDYNRTNQLIYAGKFLTTVFELDVEGEVIRVIPRDYQLDPVKDTPVHVDFQRLSVGTTIRVAVPVRYINQDIAPGIKKGGALNIVRHAVEMIVPADQIPEAITADLAGYDFGTSLHISAVPLPPGCKPVISDRDFTLATIAAPAGGADAAADAAAAPAAAAPAKGAAKPAAKPAAKK